MRLINLLLATSSVFAEWGIVNQNDGSVTKIWLEDQNCVFVAGAVTGVILPKGYMFGFYEQPRCTGRMGRYAWGKVDKMDKPYYYQSIKVKINQNVRNTADNQDNGNYKDSDSSSGDMPMYYNNNLNYYSGHGFRI